MKLFITGRGVNGSWKIRGEQLGAALGATASPRAQSFGSADAVILVKRPIPLPTSLPIIWDIVDAWPQPDGNSWSREQAIDWLKGLVFQIAPKAIVAATDRMARDIREWFDGPVLFLPHHARPGQAINPIRENVSVIGYEGSSIQLGSWRQRLEIICARRGWEFKMNPCSMAGVDVAIAMRDRKGYPARFWKSNVKLANAQATGTPIVLGRESGYLESQSGAERWADDENELEAALDSLVPFEARAIASSTLLSSFVPIEVIANRYSTWLESTLKS